MKTKSKKSFPIFFAILMLMILTNVSFAQDILSSELIVSPSSIEAGKTDVRVYILGLNTQLFSHSSKKAPTVEADAGVTINDFRILSPKRAELTIDTTTNAIGAIKHSLRFYDPAGENVVKTCVFYINVLGPKTENNIEVKLYSIPEVTLGETTIQEVGSFEIEGNITGRMTLTPPTNVKFLVDYPPRITSLSVNASVYNIEVDESGDDIEFVVENPQEETIRLFFTDLFVETSSATSSDVSGDVVLSLYSNALETPIEIPAGHTPGYTLSDEEETTDDSTSGTGSSSSSSGSTSSTSGRSSYSGTTSSSTDSTNNSARESGATSGTYYRSTYYGGGIDHSSGYSGGGGSYYGGGGNYGGGSVRSAQPNGRYVSRNAQNRNQPRPQGGSKGQNNLEDLANNLKKDMKVTPGKGGKFNIIEVSFCNEGFDKKSAVPLKATIQGFEADMNIELTIESEHSLPEIIDVVISVGEKFNRNIQLKKYKDGVFRSIDIQKFSIAYNELDKK